MLRDTPSSQDASTHQIWNSYLKEYRRYAPDTKRDGHTDRHTDGHTDGLTDGRTVRLLYASQSSFGGIKINSVLLNKTNIKADSITYADKLYIFKMQMYANILEYMTNQVLF